MRVDFGGPKHLHGVMICAASSQGIIRYPHAPCVATFVSTIAQMFPNDPKSRQICHTWSIWDIRKVLIKFPDFRPFWLLPAQQWGKRRNNDMQLTEVKQDQGTVHPVASMGLACHCLQVCIVLAMLAFNPSRLERNWAMNCCPHCFSKGGWLGLLVWICMDLLQDVSSQGLLQFSPCFVDGKIHRKSWVSTTISPCFFQRSHTFSIIYNHPFVALMDKMITHHWSGFA